MKKTIITLAALPLVMLAACSSEDEPVDSQRSQTVPEAISFRPAMAGVSRATEVTNANLPSVNVTALLNGQNYFTDLLFSKDGSGYYNSEKSYYWPGDSTTLKFYAYYPAVQDMGAEVTINKDTQEVANFEVADSIGEQIDFITATNSGRRSQYEKSGVPLEFKHRLAQIELRAKTDNKNYVYSIAGVRLGRMEYLGTFNMADSSWTLDDWHDTKVWTSFMEPTTLTSEPVSIMGTAGNAMMLPQQLRAWDYQNDPDNVAREAYFSVLIRITSDTGVTIYPFPSNKRHIATPIEGYAWASIPVDTKWEQGKKYIYTLDFTEGAGVVDPDDPTPGKRVLGDVIKVVPQVVDWVETDIPVSMKVE